MEWLDEIHVNPFKEDTNDEEQNEGTDTDLQRVLTLLAEGLHHSVHARLDECVS